MQKNASFDDFFDGRKQRKIDKNGVLQSNYLECCRTGKSLHNSYYLVLEKVGIPLYWTAQIDNIDDMTQAIPYDNVERDIFHFCQGVSENWKFL